jgi:hypothetical protein
VTITRDDLGRGRGDETERSTDERLDEGVDIREGADGARELADGDRLARSTEPLDVALGLQGEEGELGAVGRRLGVHAVGATDDRPIDRFAGAGREGVTQGNGLSDHEIDGPGQHAAQRRVDNVRRGQSVVDPRSLGLTDPVLDNVDEGRGVVVRDLFAGVDVGHELCVNDWAPLAQDLRVGRWYDTQFGQGFGGEQLDFEHCVEASLVAKEGGNVLG